jgi:hypothetical protein
MSTNNCGCCSTHEYRVPYLKTAREQIEPKIAIADALRVATARSCLPIIPVRWWERRPTGRTWKDRSSIVPKWVQS